jgi:hypothetical protein
VLFARDRILVMNGDYPVIPQDAAPTYWDLYLVYVVDAVEDIQASCYCRDCSGTDTADGI